MSDLAPALAPEPAPPTLVDPPAPAPAPEPKKPAFDPVEQALIKERDASIALKAAQAIEHRFGKHAPALEALEKGDVRGGLRQLLGDKYAPELLYEISTDFATKKEPSQEEVVATQVQKVLADEKAAETKRLEDAAKTKDEETRTANAQYLKSHLDGAAGYLKANVEQFPYLKGWGAPSKRYQELLVKHVTEHNEEPAPEVIFKLMEAEHAAKYEKTGLGPKRPAPLSLEEHVQQTFAKHRDPGSKPADKGDKPLSPVEEARRRLGDFDNEQSNRIRYR